MGTRDEAERALKAPAARRLEAKERRGSPIRSCALTCSRPAGRASPADRTQMTGLAA